MRRSRGEHPLNLRQAERQAPLILVLHELSSQATRLREERHPDTSPPVSQVRILHERHLMPGAPDFFDKETAIRLQAEEFRRSLDTMAIGNMIVPTQTVATELPEERPLANPDFE